MAVLYFTGNWALPSGKIPDGIFLQAGLAVFALRERYPFYARKQKHRSAFQVPYAHKAVCLLPCKIKKPPKWRFYILPGIGPCLPVKFLTEFSCRPGSRFLPCAKGTPFTRANKNIAPPFKSLTRIKQFACFPVK